jgi:hypothetical protein
MVGGGVKIKSGIKIRPLVCWKLPLPSQLIQIHFFVWQCVSSHSDAPYFVIYNVEIISPLGCIAIRIPIDG